MSYNDPNIPVIGPKREFPQYAGRKSVEISDQFDLILISTPHDEYKQVDFASLSVPILDTRHVARSDGIRVYQA